VKAKKDMPDTEDYADNNSEDQRAAIKRNTLAVCYLTLAFTTDNAMDRTRHIATRVNYPRELKAHGFEPCMEGSNNKPC
jgi:hypothetical protein